jgi:hypothetical protein
MMVVPALFEMYQARRNSFLNFPHWSGYKVPVLTWFQIRKYEYASQRCRVLSKHIFYQRHDEVILQCDYTKD